MSKDIPFALRRAATQTARTGGELVGNPVAITKVKLTISLKPAGLGSFATPSGMDVVVDIRTTMNAYGAAAGSIKGDVK